MGDKPIYITQFDKERLIHLIINSMSTNYRGSEYLVKLRQELDHGKVVLPTDVPADVITMNSKVLLVDTETGEEMILTLVFPEDANMDEGKISVLAPIGTAMLGYTVGNEFEWKVPDGVRKLKVKKILYQPEASGDFDL